MGKTLLQKVWDLHTVRTLPTGQTQVFIGLHLIHEVTTPQAFDALRERGWRVARPDRTFATVDHIIPTRQRQRPFLDVMAEDMIALLETAIAGAKPLAKNGYKLPLTKGVVRRTLMEIANRG